MRAIWKGHIRFSLVTIPIRIYNAVDTAQTIRFNQLHKECNGPVGYDKKCKKCSKVLEKEEIVMIGPEETGLILYKLRTPEMVRNISDVPQLDGEVADAEQMKLAQSLVDSMSTSLDKIELKDNYRQAVKEMVEAKVEDREIVTVAEEVAPVVDIMTALKDSIEQAKADRKPMKKATGKARAETKKAKKAKKTKTAAKAKKRKVA